MVAQRLTNSCDVKGTLPRSLQAFACVIGPAPPFDLGQHREQPDDHRQQHDAEDDRENA
jgi:hypothetical protein